MNSPFNASPKSWRSLPGGALLSIAIWLGTVLTVPTSLAAPNENPLEFSQSKAKNFLLLVFGYEMDAALADAIVQKKDMAGNLDSVVSGLEQLVRTKKASHVSCAATVMRPGMRTTLDAGTVLIVAEGTLPPNSEHFKVAFTRTAKTSGINTAVNASMHIQGAPVFIGTVPDGSPGKSQLLFARCVVQFLE